MTYIPDCRNDENYNQKYLSKPDKEFLRGFDWATEMAVDNFFDNEMFELQTMDSHLGHILNEEVPESQREKYEMEFTFADRENEDREVTTYADLIRMKLLEWIEMERNELITSMIDNMDDKEYEKNKKEAAREHS